MRYIAHDPAIGAASLRLAEGPAPTPGPGEILVAVRAAGVNRPDLLQRDGLYAPPPGASPVLGLEVAGEVAALGEGVRSRAVGDRVCALAPGGGYAGYCVVPEGHALPVPGGLSWVEAASLPEVWFTVWANLAEAGRLAGGERLLVHGGASGIGLAAIQLGRRLGAEVFATASTAEKCAACLAFGATRAIAYRDEDFVAVLRAAGGADVVLDIVGGDNIPRSVAALRQGGRLLIVGFMAGGTAEVDFRHVLMKRLTLTGSTLRARSVAEKTRLRDALLAHVWPGFADGSLRPCVTAVFPLEDVAAAHALMASSRHIGKIVLTLHQD